MALITPVSQNIQTSDQCIYSGQLIRPVETQGDLRLVSVEVIAAYTCYSLHVSVVLLQHVSVVLCG